MVSIKTNDRAIDACGDLAICEAASTSKGSVPTSQTRLGVCSSGREGGSGAPTARRRLRRRAVHRVRPLTPLLAYCAVNEGGGASLPSLDPAARSPRALAARKPMLVGPRDTNEDK